MRTLPSIAGARLRALAVPALLAATLGVGPGGARAEEVTEVKVEAVRPRKEKHETLRFLKENRDFIRAQFDRLRARPLARRGGAEEIDPRFLTYRDMLAEILAAKDSTAAAHDAQQRYQLLQSVTQLGDLERQLDLLGRLLGEQRERLGVLQADFTGDQRTALVVVLSGYPEREDPALSSLSITLEGGAPVTVPLSAEQRESLRKGGVVQVFHEFVEPREQVVEIGISGSPWPAGSLGFVTLDPARDRLTFLRLDLDHLRPAEGASSIRASRWLHDARISAVDG